MRADYQARQDVADHLGLLERLANQRGNAGRHHHHSQILQKDYIRHKTPLVSLSTLSTDFFPIGSYCIGAQTQLNTERKDI
jgi:hypothetical protein